MAGQKRLTEAYTPAADPEMTAVFTDSDKNQTNDEPFQWLPSDSYPR